MQLIKFKSYSISVKDKENSWSVNLEQETKKCRSLSNEILELKDLQKAEILKIEKMVYTIINFLYKTSSKYKFIIVYMYYVSLQHHEQVESLKFKLAKLQRTQKGATNLDIFSKVLNKIIIDEQIKTYFSFKKFQTAKEEFQNALSEKDGEIKIWKEKFQEYEKKVHHLEMLSVVRSCPNGDTNRDSTPIRMYLCCFLFQLPYKSFFTEKRSVSTKPKMNPNPQAADKLFNKKRKLFSNDEIFLDESEDN